MMRERRKQRRERRAARRNARRAGIERRRGERRINSVVGKAALTAALTLGAARHGDAHVHRRSTSGIVGAASLPAAPDLRLIDRSLPTPLLESSRERRRLSRNTDFDDHIRAAAEKHDLSPELVRAIIQVESGFNHRARSHRGARGLMQLMPGTARDMGARNLFDPRQNIFAGARYLRFLLDAFDGNLTLATAAYNAGPTVVKRYGGVPPYEETQDYVQKVHSLLGLPAPDLRPPQAIVDALLGVPGGLGHFEPPGLLGAMGRRRS